MSENGTEPTNDKAEVFIKFLALKKQNGFQSFLGAKKHSTENLNK